MGLFGAHFLAAPSPLSLFLFKFELVSIGVSSASWLACFDFFFGLLDVGVAGDAGVVGTTGDTGVAGDAGVAGVVGITGDTGVVTDVGVTRVAGVVGTTGDTGVAGDAGVAGTADVPCFVVDFWDGGAFVCFWGAEGYYLFPLVSGTPSSSGSPRSSPPSRLLWAGPDPGLEPPPACCWCWWWLLWLLWLLLYFRCFQYSVGKTWLCAQSVYTPSTGGVFPPPPPPSFVGLCWLVFRGWPRQA